MKAAIAAIWVAFAAAPSLPAEEAELSPIVVAATFELQPRRSGTDVFTQELVGQFANRGWMNQMMGRSPWYYARFWGYMPFRWESSSQDPSLFFLPSYGRADYQNAEEILRKSEKQPLFDQKWQPYP